MILNKGNIAAALVQRESKHGRTIVMTNGCFDIIHAGHIHLLTEAKRLGDVLVVAVNSDESVRRLKGPSRPVVRADDRMAVLDALSQVDYVVSFVGDDPSGVICEVLPDVLVKGEDYKGKVVLGADCVIKNGGRVELVPLLSGRSTTNVINTAVELKKLS